MSVKKPFSLWFVALCAFLLASVNGRKHHLELRDEDRSTIPLSIFGFLQGGVLNVNIANLTFTTTGQKPLIGFSLDRTLSDASNPYLDGKQDTCVINKPPRDDIAIAHFLFDFERKLLNVTCSTKMKNQKNLITLDDSRNKRSSLGKKLSDSSLFNSRRKKRNPIQGQSSPPVPKPLVETTCDNVRIPLIVEGSAYSASFVVHIVHEEEEGLYNLYFHNCMSEKYPVTVNANIEVVETNGDNYLSAGEIPLPRLYFIMSTLFLASGCFWVGVLCKSKREDVYKIHYLMALLVFLKSLSLAFHGINFHFIQTEGYHIEAWAVLYYITHLVKGAVLFITIILIGTGWAFIKHILSGKDKKIFVIVVPLQVLANVAYIITEESEAGQVAHITWGEIFILVDLLCCGAILFPVVWSIRHLQEASQTDGKAATSLRKLKLFRHFYILVVCYIYFTRIIVYLLKITVPFKYEWVDELFFELATYVFFVLTASKFRPAMNNPYLQLARQDLEDLELDQVVTQHGLLENVTQVGRNKKYKKGEKTCTEEKELLVSAESSHELD